MYSWDGVRYLNWMNQLTQSHGECEGCVSCGALSSPLEWGL